MSIGRNKLSILLIPIIFLIVNIMFSLYTPDLSDDIMLRNYFNLVASGWVYGIIITICLLKHPIDIFEPFTIITFIHLMMYWIAPLRSIIIDDTIHKSGVNTFGGCIKGTWIAIVVYLTMILFYENTHNNESRFVFLKSYSRGFLSESFNNLSALNISYTLWIIGFGANVLYLIMRGMSLRYILSLGTSGAFNEDLAMNSAFAFISVIGNLMFAAWLFIFNFSKKRLLCWGLFVLTLLCLLVRGFRIYIVMLCLAPILYNYLRKNRRPGVMALTIALIVCLFMIGIVGWSRGAIRTNQVESLSGFSIDSITYALWGNFDIYKSYYGVIEAIPSKMNHTFGAQMIVYTLVLFVPRAIWPGKPQPILREVILNSLNSYAVKSGAAYPAIGEWFQEFGIAGCIVLAALTGFLLKKLWWLQYDRTVIGLSMYAIIYPSLLQFVIRGYTPSNFWMLITMVLPIIVICCMCGNMEEKFEDYIE